MARSAPPVSLPGEHGAILTLAAAVGAGLAVAPSRLAALGFAVALCAGYLARGPVDRLAGRLSWRRYDRPMLWGLAFAIVAGAVAAAVWGPRAAGPVAPVAAWAIAAASYAAKRGRVQRQLLLELASMLAFAASAGAVAWAGRAAWAPAGVLAGVLMVHAGASVPLVHYQLRRERRLAPWPGGALVALALAGAAAVLLGLGHGAATLALAPRALHLLLAVTVPARPRTPLAVGLQETVALALCLTLLLLAVPPA